MNPASKSPQPSRTLASRLWLALPFVPLLLLALAPTLYEELRAASMLRAIAATPAVVSGIDTNPVEEEEIVFSSVEPVRARLYHPVGIAHPAALVVVHGMQYQGMDEPRFRHLARTMAAYGYLLLTPDVKELTEFSITSRSAKIIGDAVHELARRSGDAKVGLLATSFAGGMALISATDPAVARQLSAVIVVGAYDDLRHVLDYYATNQARAPDGTLYQKEAHPYGPLVLVYQRAQYVFSPADVAPARLAMLLALREQIPKARRMVSRLSPEGQALMAQLFDEGRNSLAPYILKSLMEDNAELDEASPHHYLQRMHVPVMLLHGATDNVIPPTETQWLAKELPPGTLADVLITRALGHVDLQTLSWDERRRLIDWLRTMFRLIDVRSAEWG
jgi:pimeloyl-ACP methyl ester carboxylesterase